MVFTERQKAELKSLMKEMSKEIVKELVDDKQFLRAISESLVDIVMEKVAEKIDELSLKINSYSTVATDIQSEQEELKQRIEELEQKSKINELRFYGVPDVGNNKTKETVEDIIKSKLEIPNVKIVHCQRIGSKNKSKKNAVVVKFDSILQRNLIYFNKKKLKGSGIVIVEEMTKGKHDLLLFAKEKLGKEKVWTVEGRLYARKDGRRLLLANEEEILKLC